MTTIDITIDGAFGKMTKQDGLLTTGMVGARARFTFDDSWEGLSRVAVFRCAGVARDVLEWDGDTVRIPAEVLAKAGNLLVGVEGHKADGSVVIPTIWAKGPHVSLGANASGDPSTDPAPPVWAQIMGIIGRLEDLDTQDKSSLVAAVNEAMRSGGGAVDEATVERIVEEYLAEHPMETDKELLVEGAPADAYVTGQNIRNIGRTLKAAQKRAYAQGEFISIRDTVLDIEGDKITLNDGYIYTPDERITVPKTTVDRNTESSVCQLVYDREDKAVRCVSGWATLEDDQILVAVIAKLYPGSVNANHIPGKWTVDGVLYPRPEAVFGLNWYALGDSITRGMYGHDGGAGVDVDHCWAALVARYNGWTLTNMGVSGSGYRAKGGTEPETDAREQVDAFNFAGAELVTLAYGVNDWMQDNGVGSMEDDVAVGGTFISNMRHCIEKIMADEPTAKIVVISPINCRNGSSEATNWGMGRANGAGATLEDFFRAEQTVCEHYGIEFIDMLHGSVVNRLNIVEALPDGVHPTLEIHEQMAKELSRKIMGGGSEGGELPGPAAPSGDYIPTPATAQVGQTMVVKEVDEYGKPVAWECADVPAGGSGGEQWELIAEKYTVEEEVASVTFDTDVNGNAFSLKKMRIFMYLPPTTDSSTYANYRINGKGSYTNPSGGWSDKNLMCDIETTGAANTADIRWYVLGTAPQLATTERVHIVWKMDGLDTIRSFEWALYNRKVMPDTTFEVWGVRA